MASARGPKVRVDEKVRWVNSTLGGKIVTGGRGGGRGAATLRYRTVFFFTVNYICSHQVEM